MRWKVTWIVLFHGLQRKKKNNNTEFIHVKFENPTFVEQFAIVESVSPGSIDQVFFYDEKGNEYLVFENIRSRPIYAYSRFFYKKKLNVQPTKS